MEAAADDRFPPSDIGANVRFPPKADILRTYMPDCAGKRYPFEDLGSALRGYVRSA